MLSILSIIHNLLKQAPTDFYTTGTSGHCTSKVHNQQIQTLSRYVQCLFFHSSCCPFFSQLNFSKPSFCFWVTNRITAHPACDCSAWNTKYRNSSKRIHSWAVVLLALFVFSKQLQKFVPWILIRLLGKSLGDWLFLQHYFFRQSVLSVWKLSRKKRVVIWCVKLKLSGHLEIRRSKYEKGSWTGKAKWNVEENRMTCILEQVVLNY